MMENIFIHRDEIDEILYHEQYGCQYFGNHEKCKICRMLKPRMTAEILYYQIKKVVCFIQNQATV